MTVSYSGVSQTVRATDVLYSRAEVVKAIVQAAMVNMAEGNVEMLLDCPEEYPTKADLERVFQGLHDQATDFVEDVFDELKQSVLDQIARQKYTARVTALRYDDDSAMSDIDVKIVFE
jgi:Zn-dependent M32 family carboxypeptidase